MKGDELLPLDSLRGAKLQRKVFARWINVQLQDVHKKVNNLVSDLADGTILVELVQALTGERLFGTIPVPTTKDEAVSNLRVSLNALAADGVEFEGIDAMELHAGNTQQVLRLLWIIILRYQVTMWDEQGIVEEDPINCLIVWLKGHVHELDESYLTSIWSDGRLLTLLVNSVVPGLCPGGQEAPLTHDVMFLERAMDRAEAWLGVPQVVSPAELHDAENLDIHSLVTYLSLFRHAELLKEGAPLCFPDKAFAIGAGITGDNVIPQFMTSFDIDCRMSGLGDLIVRISVGEEKVPYKVNVNDGVVTISYIPSVSGLYHIEILLEHEPLPGFPKSFHVYPARANPAHNIRLSGPGLETGLVSGVPTHFYLKYTPQKINSTLISVSIINENGTEFKDYTLSNFGNYSAVHYTPPCNGIFEISVLYQGVKVPSCPVFVTVIPDMQRVRITNLPSHFLPGIMGSFLIRNINQAGQGKLRIKVHPENRPAVPVQVNDMEAGVVQAFFTPTFSVNHKITVSLSATKKEPVIVPCYPCIDNIKVVKVPEKVTVNERVKFQVDCTKAGIGELFVNILDPTMSAVQEAELELLAEELFEVSYVPRQTGLFSVFLSYDSIPLPDMPLQQFVTGVPNSPVAPVPGPSVLQPVTVAQPHSIKIELKDLPSLLADPLVVSILATDGSAVEFRLLKEGKFCYMLNFTLPKVGVYTISARFGDYVLPSFPYSISSLPDLSKIIIQRETAQAKVGELVSYCIDTQQAGSHDLEAKIFGPAKHEVLDCVLEMSAEGKHILTFTPTCSGNYMVELRCSGIEFPDMPLSLEVADKNIQEVHVNGTGVSPSQTCSKAASFLITPALSSELEVSITGPQNQQVDCETSDSDEGLSFVYNAMIPGQYKIHVKHLNKHVPGSPFTTNVLPNISSCRMLPGNTSSASVGETLSFQIDCSNVCSGVLSVTVFPPFGKPFVPKVQETNPLVFDVSFHVQEEGQYGIELKHADVFLPMSPYIFRPARDLRELKVSGLSKNHRVRPGDIVEFEIDTHYFGPGYPEVYFSDSQGKSVVNYSMMQLEEKKFKVSFKPGIVETYTIVVKKESKLAANSPFSLKSTVNTSKVKIVGAGVTGSEVVVGVKAEFQVHLTEAGEGDLLVEVLNPDNQNIESTVTRTGDVAHVSYLPRVPGNYTIYPRFCGVLLPNCPFQVSASSPTATTSNISVTRRCPEVIAAGEAICMEVDTSNHKPGFLDVLAEVSGKEVELDCRVTEEGGVYDVTIPTPVSGEYVVFVKFNRKDVEGSPFKFAAKSNASKINASGDGIFSTSVPAKKKSTFYIQLNGETPSNMVVNVVGPDGYYVDEVVSEASFDLVKVEYFPIKAGTYSVEVFSDDSHIQGSPFNVLVEEVNGIEKLQISGNLIKKNTFQFQEDAFILMDQSESELEVIIKETNDGTHFQPAISNTEEGALRIKFPTYHVGNFEVSLLSSGEHIPFSPFNYMVVSKRSEKVIIDDTKDITAVVHETTRIPVITKQAGLGTLTSKCHHARLKTSCKLQTVPKSDGNYEIIFQAPQEGDYLIHVYFNNDEVPNSPLMVTAKPQTAAETYKLEPGCTRGVNGEMKFVIRGHDTDKLVVRCLDPVKEPTPHELLYLADDRYSLIVMPDADGTYLLEVFYNGFLISGCPRSFDVELKCSIDHMSVVVPDLNNITISVNQSVTFPIKMIGANGNDLEIRCVDPHGQDVDLEVHRQQDSALITFRPHKIGDHTVSVTLHGSVVAGSPFNVFVRKPDAAKQCTVKQEGMVDGVVKLKVTQKCEGILQISVVGPDNDEIPLKISRVSSEISCIDFTPTKLGLHSIEIMVDGVDIKGSPIQIDIQTLDAVVGDVDLVENDVSECDSDASLQKAFVYLQLPDETPRDYKIACVDKGENQVDVETIKRDEKSVTVRFRPTQKGRHILSLESASRKDLSCSYTVFIQNITSQDSPAFAMNNELKVNKSTLESFNQIDIASMEQINKPVYIGFTDPTVFTLKEWKRDSIPHIHIVHLETRNVLPHNVVQNKDGTFSITCHPVQPGKHKILVTCDSEPVPGTPLLFHAVMMQGAPGVVLEGVQTSLVAMSRTQFGIDARNAGPGDIEVTVCNAFGYLPVDVVDHDNYTYTAKYQPIKTGDYTIEVLFNGEHVGNTPLKVEVLAAISTDKKGPKIKRRMKDDPIFANSDEPTEFIVYYETKAPIKFKIVNMETRETLKYRAKRHRDGTYSLLCTPEKPGNHMIRVYENGDLITRTPYKFHVIQGEGTWGVVVTGPGVQDGVRVGEETCFTIDTNRAGSGVLEVVVLQEGVTVPVTVTSKSDYVFTCKYVAPSPNPLKVSVMFDKQHVIGSPWTVSCDGFTTSKEDKPGLVAKERPKISDVSAPSETDNKTVAVNKTAAFCGLRAEEGSTTETDASSTSSLPTLSFSLPVRVSMEDGHKYIKLLIPINDLPALSNPKVYHADSSTKIPAAIVFSRHGYVLKCCPTLYGKYKVNVFDRSSESVDPLVFFYFNFVESIKPSTSKIFALRSIHPTDFFPMETNSIQPMEIFLTTRKVKTPILVNTMCIFVVPKGMLTSPANVTVANRTTNQYIYSKTIMREDESPGIMCYPSSPGHYRITLYPSSSEAVEIKFNFTVLPAETGRPYYEQIEHVPTGHRSGHHSGHHSGRQSNKVASEHQSHIPHTPAVSSDTVVRVTNLRTGVQIPAGIKAERSGNFTIQCEPTDPGKYIVQMTVNGLSVAGSPMYFTVGEEHRRPREARRAVYDVSGEVRHCVQEIHYQPNKGVPDQGVINQGLPEQGTLNQALPEQGVPEQVILDAVPSESRLPSNLASSEQCSVSSDKIAVIKPCNNIFRSLAEQKARFYGGGALKSATPDDPIVKTTSPSSTSRDDGSSYPVQILLPYFPEEAKISVFNETSGTVAKSSVEAHEQTTMMLRCDVTSVGRHRVDVVIDDKPASCGPLYFDVSSLDPGETKLDFPEDNIDQLASCDPASVSTTQHDVNRPYFEQYIVGFAFENAEQVPVSLSSFSEESSEEEGERQEIRIQSSLELAALRVDVVNEDTGETLRARLIERNGDYVVRCRPSDPGHYRVNVREGESDVEGSPFFFDVLPQETRSPAFVSPVTMETTSDSDTRSAVRREIYFLNPGNCDFERTLSTVGEAEIVFYTSSLVNPQTLLTMESTNQEVPASSHNNGDGTHTLRFSPPTSGRYKLDVWDSTTTLSGSPFYFEVNDTEMAASPTKTRPIVYKGQSFGVGKSEHTFFKIPTTQNVEVDIYRGNTAEKISYKLVTEGSHSTIICKPYHAGEYTVSVRHPVTRQELDFSPFYFTVPELQISPDRLPRAESPVEGVRHEHLSIKSSSFANTNTSGIMFVSEYSQSHYLARRGTSPKFVLSAKQQPDVKINDLATNNIIPYTIQPYDDGSYIIEASDRTPGRYLVTASLDGITLPGTPFTYQVPDTTSSTTEIVSNATGAFELQNIDECIRRGDPIVLTIVAEEHPITRVTNLATRETIHVDVTQQDDMTYKITFCPFKSGRHEVMIRCKGVQVSGSPFFLDVEAVSVSPRNLNTIQSINANSVSQTQTVSREQVTSLTNFQSTSTKTTAKFLMESHSTSSSESSRSEFDDTSSTVFSDFSDTTKNTKTSFTTSSSSSSSDDERAVFITDTKTNAKQRKTSRSSYERLSVQRQLRNKIRLDSTKIHHSRTFTSTDGSLLPKPTEEPEKEEEISTPEHSDEEEIIDPYLFKSSQNIEFGKTLTVNIESKSVRTVVKSLKYNYQISHRIVEKKFGKPKIRFKPMFDGKYKIDCFNDLGGQKYFPLFVTVGEPEEPQIKTIDPSGQIPPLTVNDIVRIQVFARSQPKCKLYYLNRKLKIYCCTVDEGLDRYIVSFIPCFPGKYKLFARDNIGELTFSPLTLDVSPKEKKIEIIEPKPITPDIEKVEIWSYKGQETSISVDSEVCVSLVDSGYESTFVSVKSLETKIDVPFSVSNCHESKRVLFSPKMRGGYAISVLGENGHMSYSPIILYVSDQFTYDWQKQIDELQVLHGRKSEKAETTTETTTEVVVVKETTSSSTKEVTVDITKRETSPFRCISPVDCPYLNHEEPRSRSPTKITFDIESTRIEYIDVKTEIDATFIKFEQSSPKPSSPIPLPEIPEERPTPVKPDKTSPPIEPYFAIIYPKTENELFKIFIHGLDMERAVPLIVVTHVATLNQIQVYTARENGTLVVRLKPIYSGLYHVDLYESGISLPCSPFIITLDSAYLKRYVVETTKHVTEIDREQSIVFSEENVCARIETRTSFYKTDYPESPWGDNLVECDIVNKQIDNVTISSKTLRFHKEEAFTSTRFDLEFESKEETYEKISPEPPEEKVSPLILTIDLPSYPTVNVVNIHTQEELIINITKEDDSYIIKGQPQEPGHFKIDILLYGEHTHGSPFYIEISKNKPSSIIFASMRPGAPRPEDIIMMQKRMRRRRRKKKKRIDPSIPYLDGRPIDVIHLPTPGLFKDQVTTTTTTTKTTNEITFTRTRRTVTTKTTSMTESERQDYANNALVDFHEAAEELSDDMRDLKLYLENYLDANIGDLSDTDDEREGYRYTEQRRFLFLDENSSHETDVFSKETKSIEFGFKCADAWCEEVHIFLLHEKSQKFIRTRLQKLETKDEFSCFARIHESGRHILEIFHKDRRLFGRRFYLLAGEAMGADGLKMWGPGFVGPVVVGIKTWFFISFEKSGAGVLSCVYTDVNEDPISLEANETEQDVYKFEYTPTVLGTIDIDVTFDEEEAPGVPKQIECIRKPQLSNGATKFDLGRHKLEHIDVRVEDYRGLEIEASIIKLVTNEISVTFTPEIHGKHTITAKKGNTNIKGSPIHISIKDEAIIEEDILAYYAQDPFDATNQSNDLHPTVTGTVTCRQQYVFAKDPVEAEFIFVAKEAFVGMLKAHIKNQDTGEDVPNSIDREGDLSHVIKVRCPRAGKHSLNLTVSGLTIPGCPLFFHCIDGLGAAGIRVSGQGYTGPHHEGILNVFTLNTGLAGPGVLEVLLRDKMNTIHVNVKDTEDGKILCSYTPGDLPVYMEILFDKAHVPGSPRVVPPYEVFESTTDESSSDEDGEMTGEQKDVMYFYVNEHATMDLDYDSIGDLQVEVVNFEDESIKTKAKVTTISAGKYVISFKPKIKGLHMVEVFDGEFQLSNSPFFVTVLEARGKLAIEMYGPGIEGPLVLNRRTAFTVNTSGAGAGVLEVLVETEEETVPVTVEDNFNDSITCYYIPTIWTDHTISILYNKEHVKDSPKVLKVYEVDPSKRSIDDLDNGIVVKIPPGSDQFLFVEVEDPEKQMVTSSFTKLGSDCIKVCFETPVHGIYLCNVFFHNVHIRGSPIEILVGGPGGGAPLVPGGPGNFPKSLRPVNVGEPSQIIVASKYKLRLDVDIVHEETQIKIPATQKIEHNGEIKIIFTPLQVGGHVINISVKGSPLPGCPLAVQAVTAPGADAAKVDGLDPDGDSGRRNSCAPFHDLDEFGDFGPNNDPNARKALELYLPHASETRKRKEKVLRLERGVMKSISIDTRTCGQGMVQVAVASNMGEIPISMHQNNDETYTASFTPHCDGLLKISIRFNNEDVPGSPYIAVVGDPQPVTLDFNRFTVHCYDPQGDLVNSALYEAPDGTVKLRFQPELPGQHRVEIYNGECHIQGSPFIVHVNRGDVEEKKDDFDILQGDAVLITQLKEKVIHAWDHVTILLPSTPGEDGIGVTFMVTGKPDNSWRLINLGDTVLISWCPTRGGRYRFELTDKEGLQSTYFVEVNPVLDHPGCVLSGPAFDGDVILNKTSHFTIDCSNSGNNTISLVLQNEANKIPILLEEITHFFWKCTFHPTTLGEHIAVLHLDKTLYSERILRINVARKSKGSCRLTDLSPPIASVGVTVRFALHLMIVSADDIVISVFDPNDELIECFAKTFDGVNVNVEFVAETAGRHRVNVETEGEELEGSPILIGVQGDGYDVSESPTAILKNRIASTSICVGDGETIVARSGDEDKIKSAVSLATQFDIQNSTPKRPTSRNLRSREVKVATSRNISSVITSPINANFTPVLPRSLEEAASPTVTKSESAVLVGDEVNFVIRNVLSTDYNIHIDGPAGYHSYCHSFYDETNRTVNFKYVPEVPGNYSVRLFNKQSEIFESPIEFKVMPLAEPRIYLVVKGEGISKGIVNKPTSFEVITNSSGNLTVSIEGPADTKIRVADRGSSSGCVVTYYPTVVGNYAIHLHYAGVAVDGSPFVATVVDPEEPITLLTDKVYVDERFSIPLPKNVDLRDLIVSVGGPDGISTRVQISKDSGNKSVTYVPNIPGKYKLILDTSAGPVPGSPFNLTALPRVSLECTCTGKPLTGMKVREMGTLAIEYNLENPGGLSYSIVGPSRPTLHISRRDSVDFVSFNPRRVGKYQLIVKYNNRILKQSPFTFTVIDMSHFNFLYLLEALKTVQLNKHVAITLNTTRCGPGEVSAELQGPLHYETVEVTSTPHTATIKFRAEKPGYYKLAMFYNGIPFPQSPFPFHVSRKAGGKVTGMLMEGEGLKVAYVNKSNYIYVNDVPKSTGMQVEVMSAQKMPQEVRIHCGSTGVNTVEYFVVAEGVYTISVKWEGQHLVGSPFTVPAYLRE